MKYLKNSCWLLALLWKQNKPIYFCFISEILLNVLLNTIGIAIINYLIQYLSDSEYQSAFIAVLILCLSTLVLNTLVSFLQYKKQGYLNSFNVFIKCMLTDSTLSTNFDNFEKCDFREQYQFATKCVTSGNIQNIINAVCSFVTYILSFIALSSIISYVVWWLWIIILSSTIINIICEFHRANINFESEKSQNSVEIKMLYSRDRLTWKLFAKEVRLFDMFSYVSNQVNKYINLLSKLQDKRANKIFKALWWTYLFNGILMLAVYLYVSYKCYTGVFELSQFSTLILSILSINQMASGISGSILSIKENGLYISTFIDFINNHKQSDETSRIDKCRFNTISFEDVSFKYDGENNFALKNISLTLSAGKKYGIVGKNGSGKTTFTNLLMGLYSPTEGVVKVDGKNISEINPNEYMKYFSPIFQNYNMYAYDVKENISMNACYDISRVYNLLNKVNFADNDCTQFADKFITKEYSPDGIEFSGGQEQKIAIARALYKDAPIFVLDEPSSALSPKSELELYELVNKQLKDKTTFFVSHRMASCILCDEILVFDNGEIVEKGSHSELMSNNGLYHKMFTSQRKLFSEVRES